MCSDFALIFKYVVLKRGHLLDFIQKVMFHSRVGLSLTVFKFKQNKQTWCGRAITQAVSRRLPTAAAWVQTRVGTWDFVMDKSGAGAGFLQELRFPLPMYIPSCSPQLSSLSPEAGTIGQEWPQCL
jgi:hypothetical protein